MITGYRIRHVQTDDEGHTTTTIVADFPDTPEMIDRWHGTAAEQAHETFGEFCRYIPDGDFRLYAVITDNPLAVIDDDHLSQALEHLWSDER